MVYIPGLGSSSFPGGLAGVPGPAGSSGTSGYGVSTADGRLTTVSGTPILTTTQSAKTTLYYTPFKGNQIAVYSGSVWSVLTFAETSLSLSGFTASKNYDIWGYNNAGVLALDSTVWTNDTTRATALTTQDGIYCKTGDTTRRYLGTVRINSTGGQIDWAPSSNGSGGVEVKATIWNENNRILFSFTNRDVTTSWTHAANGTWVSLNGSTNNRFTFVLGRSVEQIEADLSVRATTVSGGTGTVAFGLDITSAPASNQLFGPTSGTTNTPYVSATAKYANHISAGNHYLQALDYSVTQITTFYGYTNPYTQSGMLVRGWF